MSSRVQTLFFAVFLLTPLTSGQSCGETKSSVMHYTLVGHVYNVSEVAEYPSCMKRCLKDVKCASCNYDLIAQQCQLSNTTKALAPDKFVKKEYSIYTEMLT